MNEYTAKIYGILPARQSVRKFYVRLGFSNTKLSNDPLLISVVVGESWTGGFSTTTISKSSSYVDITCDHISLVDPPVTGMIHLATVTFQVLDPTVSGPSPLLFASSLSYYYGSSLSSIGGNHGMDVALYEDVRETRRISHTYWKQILWSV
eukprot:jgi/Mesvir1/195/Mv25421-RA.1